MDLNYYTERLKVDFDEGIIEIKNSVETSSSKDIKSLQHILRLYKNSDKDTVLCALFIYCAINPVEALWFARKRGLFSFYNRWEYAIKSLQCIENFAALYGFDESITKYVKQKLELSWLLHFYEKSEKQIIKLIKEHHKKRIIRKLKGHIVETNLVIELLAYLERTFRLFIHGTEHKLKKVVGRDSIDSYSQEEVCEAVSYLIALYMKEYSIKKTQILWLDADYVLGLDIKRLILKAAKLKQIQELEMLVDYYGYSLCNNGRDFIITDESVFLEQSIRGGYIKTRQQEQLSTLIGHRLLANKIESLFRLGTVVSKPLYDQVFIRQNKYDFFDRYQLDLTHLLPLVKSLIPEDFTKIKWFFEEEGQLRFSSHEFLLHSLDEIEELPVSQKCKVKDLLLFKRYFTFVTFAQSEFFSDKKEFKLMINSIVPTMKQQNLEKLAVTFIGSEEKAKELLNVLVWNGKGKLDLQYTPILHLGNDYFIAPSVLSYSNLIRNLIVNNRDRFQKLNSNGEDDRLILECQHIFKECTYPYKFLKNLKFTYNGREGEIDFLLWSEENIYVFECKNAVLPTNFFEMRNAYEYILKATQQLTHITNALENKEFREKYFSIWNIKNINKNINAAIISGNRLFTVHKDLKYPVRYIYELDMVVNSGQINSSFGSWTYWKSEEFTDNDLKNFLSHNDPLTKTFCRALFQYQEKMKCDEKNLILDSWTYVPEIYFMEMNKVFQKVEGKTEML